MQPTLLPKEESPLLDYAIQKLYPSIFSHPIWVRFAKKNESEPAIQNLRLEIENLRQQHPEDACQLLLLCAVLQHYTDQTTSALKTIREAQDLAETAALDQAILWALWGQSSICIQQENYYRAADLLDSLSRRLNSQDEWILADLVDVLKNALVQFATSGRNTSTALFNDSSRGGLLMEMFGWIDHWGFSGWAPNTADTPAKIQQPSPFQNWAGRWRSLRLLFRGELRVNWLDVHLHPDSSRRSLLRSLLGLLHVEVNPPQNRPDVLDSQLHPELHIAIPQVEQAPYIVEQPEDRLSTLISTQMLGAFGLTVQERQLSISSKRGLSLLKYLIHNHKQRVPREVLMDVFWPEVTPQNARNNLNVAMSGIRHGLRTVTDSPLLLYKDNSYGFAPEIQFWVDVEEFERLVDSGRRLETREKLRAAISEYEAATSLYRGDFLEENPYETWTIVPRERLRLAYLGTLDRLSEIYYSQQQYAMCITLSQIILSRDPCREDAHCLLMRCYSRQGQDHLALRQYQACVEALRMELDVAPAAGTTLLYEQIRKHRYI